MTEWQDATRIVNAAFLQSQIACAMIEMESMKAANTYAVARDRPQPFSMKDIKDLIDKYQIGHNSALDTLRNGL